VQDDVRPEPRVPRSVPEDPPPFEPFEIARTDRIYDSKWCGLRRDWLVLPDGSEQEYHVVEIPDAVAVVPVTREGAVVLVGQFRHPNQRTHWEVPAGRIHGDEEPEAAARREVREETGYVPARLVPLPGFYAANGISAHYAHVFVGEDCVRVGEPELDPCERLTVRAFERDEIGRLLDAGRIADGFSAIALLYWLRRESAR
jgi:ADP-ribose pyrophosphatase